MSETTQETFEQQKPKVPLKVLRSKVKLTQKELASRAGIAQNSYIDIEKNRVRPRFMNAYAIVEVINKELEVLGKGNEQVTTSDVSWSILGE